MEPAAQRLMPEPVEDVPMASGRPHQDFVENRLRQYLQDSNIRSLVKPTQEEIRSAAMPILCQGLRRRKGDKKYLDPKLAHRGVAAMVQHALEKGWINPPFSEAYVSPTYVEAMIELARDARWFGTLQQIKEGLNSHIEFMTIYLLPNLTVFEKKRLEQEFLSIDSLDDVCALYSRTASMEREYGLSPKQLRFEKSPLIAGNPDHSSTFVLGEKNNLKAEAVVYEIKRYLRAFCHPFVSMAVKEMEYGRSLYVQGYRDLLCVTSGLYRAGYCAVFYYEDESQHLFTIVGLGYFLKEDKYLLDYKSGVLEGCGRILRIS